MAQNSTLGVLDSPPNRVEVETGLGMGAPARVVQAEKPPRGKDRLTRQSPPRRASLRPHHGLPGDGDGRACTGGALGGCDVPGFAANRQPGLARRRPDQAPYERAHVRAVLVSRNRVGVSL